MTAIDFTKLLHSITYYLSYQERIGRNFMVSESSLKYPVADYLTGLEMPLTHIQLEHPHPYLKKRQIDLVTTDETKDFIETAFEFKIARNNTKYDAEQQRIFSDLMRLHLIAKSNKSSCYFIVAGSQEDFIQYFRSIPSTRPASNSINAGLPAPGGFYKEWFYFEKNEVRTFPIKNALVNDYQKIYDTFLDDYKTRESAGKIKLPANLTTTCIAISALSRDFPTPYVGGIWKVE
jgi:hypothetical protein